MGMENGSSHGNGFDNSFSIEELKASAPIAVENAIGERLRNGLPVVRYDTASRKVYLEHLDGKTEYIPSKEQK